MTSIIDALQFSLLRRGQKVHQSNTEVQKRELQLKLKFLLEYKFKYVQRLHRGKTQREQFVAGFVRKDQESLLTSNPQKRQ